MKKVFIVGLLATVVGVILFAAGVFPVRPYIVSSDSMGDRGSIVVVHTGHYRKPDPKHPQAVTFKGPNGETVTHDLIGFRSDDTAITKGSMNKTVDPGHASRSAIIGGVIMTIPFIGGVILFLGTSLGLTILGMVLLVAVLYMVLVRPKPQPGSTETALDHKDVASSVS